MSFASGFEEGSAIRVSIATWEELDMIYIGLVITFEIFCIRHEVALTHEETFNLLTLEQGCHSRHGTVSS
jgi:hypothetical protein